MRTDREPQHRPEEPVRALVGPLDELAATMQLQCERQRVLQGPEVFEALGHACGLSISSRFQGGEAIYGNERYPDRRLAGIVGEMGPLPTADGAWGALLPNGLLCLCIYDVSGKGVTIHEEDDESLSANCSGAEASIAFHELRNRKLIIPDLVSAGVLSEEYGASLGKELASLDDLLLSLSLDAIPGVAAGSVEEHPPLSAPEFYRVLSSLVSEPLASLVDEEAPNIAAGLIFIDPKTGKGAIVGQGVIGPTFIVRKDAGYTGNYVTVEPEDMRAGTPETIITIPIVNSHFEPLTCSGLSLNPLFIGEIEASKKMKCAEFELRPGDVLLTMTDGPEGARLRRDSPLADEIAAVRSVDLDGEHHRPTSYIPRELGEVLNTFPERLYDIRNPPDAGELLGLINAATLPRDDIGIFLIALKPE